MKNILLKIKNSLFSQKLENEEKNNEVENVEISSISISNDDDDDDDEFTDEERKRGMDEVYLAYIGGDLEKKLKVTEINTTPQNRNILLYNIVTDTYKLRKEEKYKNLCLKFSKIHLGEFPELVLKLRRSPEKQLGVPTFQYYSTLLTELGEYEKAIDVCQMAINYNVVDNTKGGYQGRIDRIKKKMISK
jgi:hypothetical protein